MSVLFENWDESGAAAILALLFVLPLVPTILIYAMLNTASTAQYIKQRKIGDRGKAIIRLGGPVAFYFIMFSGAVAAYANLSSRQFHLNKIAETLDRHQLTADQLSALLERYARLEDYLSEYSLAIDGVKAILLDHDRKRQMLERVAGVYCYSARFAHQGALTVNKGALRFSLKSGNALTLSGFDKEGNQFDAVSISVGDGEMYYQWHARPAEQATRPYAGVSYLRFDPNAEGAVTEMRGDWFGGVSGSVTLVRAPDEGHCEFQSAPVQEASQ